MTDSKPVHIISDSPATGDIAFGFDKDAKTIAELIANKHNETPMVIGIYGAWGTGKTTLMEKVKSSLQSGDYQDLNLYRVCKPVWFQAWKYKEEDQILAALIEEIFKTMKRDDFFSACRAELEKLVILISPPAILKSFSKVLAGMDITEIFAGLKHKEKLAFYDAFNDFFGRILWAYLNWQPKVCAAEEVDDQKGALVIFIDDLDRCPVGRIVSILETIKLFMDKKGCIFVIGASEAIVENALRPTYKDDAPKFLEKIVQVTFNLPQVPAEDFDGFVETISADLQQRIGSYLPLIVPALNSNPRRVKRFLNNLSLREAMLRNREVSPDYKNLLYWNIIESVYPNLRRDLQGNPLIINTLKDHLNALLQKNGNLHEATISDELLKDVPQSLHRYLHDTRLVEILIDFDPSPEEIKQFITASAIIKPDQDSVQIETTLPPFESGTIIKIPGNMFLYGQDRNKEMVEAFAIDIYPVTNQQYERFISAGGYHQDGFWSEEGLKWRKESNISQPRYWNDIKLKTSDHPVVGVSYFEAEAYANWANKRLPTEREWERAARGTDGRLYPWGDDFDKDKCNTLESKLGRTSPVTQYPNGISPDGCYDMAGNVWEWTDTWYDKNMDAKVLRGGSWNNDRFNARCALRTGCDPYVRDNNFGFRCARTVTAE